MRSSAELPAAKQADREPLGILITRSADEDLTKRGGHVLALRITVRLRGFR